MKTFSAKPTDITRDWLLVDAANIPLGRLASEVAQLLRGKHKPIFTPHMDTGDFVVVINAEKIKLTGKKMEQKTYFTHSGYLGGGKETPIKKLLAERPERVINLAVKGMLPHNRLGRAIIKKLKVYAGNSHPHEAQQLKKYHLHVEERANA
ncbi:MAG TPA: 50S ribosomal protein L13 [Actinobacteria bacterium]|nr:50S ribosomal protein L13 [Actinomycetes bacterium]HEX21320.1 50S ribosomal protein L13 [Actinomycetota bacterium]